MSGALFARIPLMTRPLALLLALLLPALASGAGVVAMDQDEPPKQTKRRKGKAAKPAEPEAEKGEIQIGAFASPTPPPEDYGAAPEPSKAPIAKPLKSSAGIFPVYPEGGRWLVVDRSPGGKKGSKVAEGMGLLIVGSKGIAEFAVGKSSWTFGAACSKNRPARTLAWKVSGRKAAFLKVGEPIVAILLKPGSVYDVSQALFTQLKNEVGESVYKKLDFPIRKVGVEDLKAGAFPILPDDADGAAFAREPDPLRLQMKVDFAAKVGVKGLKDALVLVEGTQVSNSYRRCLRLFEEKEPLGGCVEMPHVLMTETRQLEFVSYDPSRGGSPFIFAFTKEAPLWGHERWGFQVNAQGAKLFLRDALDPKCREGF